jgi:hypothetical protein
MLLRPTTVSAIGGDTICRPANPVLLPLDNAS